MIKGLLKADKYTLAIKYIQRFYETSLKRALDEQMASYSADDCMLKGTRKQERFEMNNISLRMACFIGLPGSQTFPVQ